MTSVVLASAEPLLSALVRGVNAVDPTLRVFATTSLGTSALERAASPVFAVYVANPPASWSLRRIHRAVREVTVDATIATLFVPDDVLADADGSDRIASRWLHMSRNAPAAPHDGLSGPEGRRATIRLEAELAAPSVARRFVREVLADWGCDDLVERAQLCASELATNAVLHAGDGTIELELRCTSADDIDVHLSVADDAVDRLPVGRRPSARSRGGRGLRIVEASTSLWGVTILPRRKVVWCELRRQPGRARRVEPLEQGAPAPATDG